MKSDSGFTMVEMMIVIGVMAVLSAIATLSYLSMRPGLRLNGATRQVMGELMAARMKAVNLNRKVKVFFPAGNIQYKICDDADGDGTVDEGEGDVRLINIQDNYPNVTLTSNNEPIFSPRGTASNLPTITLSNSNGSKSLSIAMTGRVKIN